METDASLSALLSAMEGAFAFTEDLASLTGKMDSLERTIVKIFEQTAEAAIFIREYTGRGFAGESIVDDTNGDS